ncbi:MAG: DNA alkylation repair protein [Pirellulaceae bacterium]
MSRSQSGRVLASHVENDLRALRNPEKAAFFPRFFKAEPGGYAEGDQFLGVIVPDLRKIAKRCVNLEPAQLSKLFRSKWHECRLTAVFILVQKFEAAHRDCKSGKTPASEPKQWVDFYLDHLDFVNNWDLVDASAHKILGVWFLDDPKQRSLMRKLANSKDLWRQRVAVISNFPLIKSGQHAEILELAERFLHHKHDLMHKAVGWMLREMGKNNLAALRGFLQQYAAEMPRTMLRYSIEKLSPAERKKWMHQKAD